MSAKILHDILLVLSSTAWLLVIYGISHKIQIMYLDKIVYIVASFFCTIFNIDQDTITEGSFYGLSFANIPNFISYLLYILFPIAMGKMALSLVKKSSSDSLEIQEIEDVSCDLLPVYLGYFFVGLSIQDLQTLFWIYVLIFGFVFLSRKYYYNPCLLLLGYHFYKVKYCGKTFMLIDKEIYSTQDVSSSDMFYLAGLKRINNTTFINGDSL